jgi:hypothetical protein
MMGHLALSLGAVLAPDYDRDRHVSLLDLSMWLIVGWLPDKNEGLPRSDRLKNQYVGDVNDFCKYQLLRAMRRVFDSILIAWMLTAPDGRKDGGRVRYLEDRALRQLDPELFDALSGIVENGNRSVGAIEESRILGDCRFLSKVMPVDPMGRREYFEGLMQHATPRSLIFFDPDNGLEVRSVPKHRQGSERYLFWDELALVREAGASAVVYQHFPRVQRPRYLEARLTQLQTAVGDGYRVFASHSSLVAFLFAVREDRAIDAQIALEGRCQSTLLSFVPWSGFIRG